MQKIRMLLKSIFEEAVNDDPISKNPMRRLPVPNTPDPDKPVLEKVDAAGVLKAMAQNNTKTGIRDYAITRIGTFYAVRSAEVFGLRWECDLGEDLFIKHSAWEGKLYERHTKKSKPRKVAVDTCTRQALDRWKEISDDPHPEALMFPSEKPGAPFTSRNWLERNLPASRKTPRNSDTANIPGSSAQLRHTQSETTEKRTSSPRPRKHRNYCRPLCGRDAGGGSQHPITLCGGD